MRGAFTLIELLIVLVIMVLVMGVVIPQGSKMFTKYQKNFDKMQVKQQIFKNKAYSFLTLEKKSLILNDINYTTTIKGVIIEKRHDND